MIRAKMSNHLRQNDLSAGIIGPCSAGRLGFGHRRAGLEPVSGTLSADRPCSGDCFAPACDRSSSDKILSTRRGSLEFANPRANHDHAPGIGMHVLVIGRAPGDKVLPTRRGSLGFDSSNERGRTSALKRECAVPGDGDDASGAPMRERDGCADGAELRGEPAH